MHKKTNWLCLFGNNGWAWDAKLSIDEGYSFYGAKVLGVGSSPTGCSNIYDTGARRRDPGLMWRKNNDN